MANEAATRRFVEEELKPLINQAIPELKARIRFCEATIKALGEEIEKLKFQIRASKDVEPVKIETRKPKTINKE